MAGRRKDADGLGIETGAKPGGKEPTARTGPPSGMTFSGDGRMEKRSLGWACLDLTFEGKGA